MVSTSPGKEEAQQEVGEKAHDTRHLQKLPGGPVLTAFTLVIDGVGLEMVHKAVQGVGVVGVADHKVALVLVLGSKEEEGWGG